MESESAPSNLDFTTPGAPRIPDGKNNFKITHFFPFYGASKTGARNFEVDGDLDTCYYSRSTKREMDHHGSLHVDCDGDKDIVPGSLCIP